LDIGRQAVQVGQGVAGHGQLLGFGNGGMYRRIMGRRWRHLVAFSEPEP